MLVPTRAQRIVVRARRWVERETAARPVIQRVPQPWFTRIAHVDGVEALTTAFGHRGSAPVRPQHVIIAAGHCGRRLGEHRGGHHSSDTWQGPENLDVTMLA